MPSLCRRASPEEVVWDPVSGKLLTFASQVSLCSSSLESFTPQYLIWSLITVMVTSALGWELGGFFWQEFPSHSKLGTTAISMFMSFTLLARLRLLLSFLSSFPYFMTWLTLS